MPILTPTYPHQNSTFNVTANTLKLIKEKMGVAADICDQIMEGKETWETLFQVIDDESPNLGCLRNIIVIFLGYLL